jgi:5-deoxy-glucuronate isomerase
VSDLIVNSKSGPDANGSVVKVTPESAGWGYVGFEILRLPSGAAVERRADGEEACLVPISGTCSVVSENEAWEIGGRKGPFDGPPHALYLPPETDYRIEAAGELELAVCSAPAESGVEPFVIRPEEIQVEVRGSGNMEREVRPILMAERPAERLLVVEVLTPNGHWSSYPPHKHDRDAPPEETYLEETYYHRVRPESGFAVQRVYTDDRSLDETLSVGDGDVVLVPKGYHPVSAPPGYDLYYLNVMAGPTREWKFKNDPDHEWLF